MPIYKDKITPEKLTELEALHGRIAHLKSKTVDDKGNHAWEIVLRKPSRPEYKQFRAQSHNPNQIAEAQEILARKTVVYPSREEFDVMLDDWPALPEACGESFKLLTGLAVAEDVK